MKPKGDLSEVPFSFLLFQLWQSRSTGILRVEEDLDKSFYFQEGEIALAESRFQKEYFFDYLGGKDGIDPLRLKNIREKATEKTFPPVRTLIEGEAVRPDRLWVELKEFLLDEISQVFDWGKGQYSFDKETTVDLSDILLTVPALEVIQYGCRKMKNFEIIYAQLPEKNESFHLITDIAKTVRLQPEEHYILRSMKGQANLLSLYKRSALGEKETQKIFFLLLSLGFIQKDHPVIQPRRPLSGETEDLRKILSDLNEKSSYIFKYMSKEIGPVSQNVLKKSLDDIRDHLSPVFKEVHFDANGRFDDKKIWERAALASQPYKQVDIQGDMNEILAAEVLAIKSTLGDEHETQLIESLEKL